MLAAGAGFSSNKANLHCNKNGEQDSAFCDDPGFIFRIIQSFRSDVKLRTTNDPFQYDPIFTGKAVLIAPFPKWLRDKEDIPIAFDPEGFDRPAFINSVNEMILRALGTP